MGKSKEEKKEGKKKRWREGGMKEGKEGGWQKREDRANFYFLTQKEKATEEASCKFQQLPRQGLQ